MMTLEKIINRMNNVSYNLSNNNFIRDDRIYMIPYRVNDKEDCQELEFDVPGVKKEELDVSTKENMIFVSCNKSHSAWTIERDLEQYILVDKIRARLEHGVLTVTLPFNETVQKRRIKIE